MVLVIKCLESLLSRDKYKTVKLYWQAKMGQWLKRWKDDSDNFEVSEEEVGVVQTITQI